MSDSRSDGWVRIPNDGEHTTPPGQISSDFTWPMYTGAGPCRTWPIEPGCGCLPNDPKTLTAAQQHAIEAATEILWRLTAGLFGLCRETVRPCRRDCVPNECDGYPTPALIGGTWVNLSCHHGKTCGCSYVDEIALPGPVYWEMPASLRPPDEPDDEVNPGGVDRYDMRIWIDGDRVPSGKYWMFDGNRVFRTDGQSWPACQDLTRPLTDPNTFGIMYWRGRRVPAGGRRAVSLLACELFKACQGSSDCQLPARVQQVQREGVSMTMVDNQEFLERGRTGVTEVDLWLSSVNPHGQRQPAAVYSPDGPTVRSEWTSGSYPQ